jgi:hypothetical protein
VSDENTWRSTITSAGIRRTLREITMSHRTSRYLLLPLLALCLTFAASSAVRAQSHMSGNLQINFGSQPSWEPVSGTRVLVMNSPGRPDYDVYRYGGRYYAYNNNQWYYSRNGRGHYSQISERNVPQEFNRIPRQQWQHYPSTWNGNSRNNRHNRNGNGNQGNGNGNH